MTRKPGTAKRPEKRNKEISIAGYDVSSKDTSKEKVLEEVFGRLADFGEVSSGVQYASSLKMVKNRYLSADVGSVGGGLFFIEMGCVSALKDYCVLLAKLPRAVDWKTIDGEKVRLIWAFGFHQKADRQFVVDFTAYLSRLFLDPGIWSMLTGRTGMTKSVEDFEAFIGEDIQADRSIQEGDYKKAKKHCERAQQIAGKSSRIKTKIASINEMESESARVLKSYRDGK